MEYGKIVNGKLTKSTSMADGYKPVQYADVPLFDQYTEYVTQADAVDDKGRIWLDVKVNKVVAVEKEIEKA